MMMKRHGKSKLFVVTLLLATMIGILLIGFVYGLQKKFYLQNIDEKLKIAAQAGSLYLGSDLVDQFDHIHPMNHNDHLTKVKELSKYAQENGIDYIYLMVKEKNKVYIVLSSATPEELANQTYDLFYTPYLASEMANKSFTKHDGYYFYENTNDKYGTFQSYCQIKRSKGGKTYLIGADIKIDTIQATLKKLLTISTSTFIIVLLIIISVLTLRYFEIKQMNAQLLKLSITDKLTGLFNRQYTDKILTEEAKKIDRYSTYHCSILMIDVDHFKELNDKFGHLTGDSILKQLADIMKNSLRESDTIGRWGGEEFIVILPLTTSSQALRVADNLRLRVQSYFLKLNLKVTVSIGVGELKSENTINKSMINIDHALYLAKEYGRNRVESTSV